MEFTIDHTDTEPYDDYTSLSSWRYLHRKRIREKRKKEREELERRNTTPKQDDLSGLTNNDKNPTKEKSKAEIKIVLYILIGVAVVGLGIVIVKASRIE